MCNQSSLRRTESCVVVTHCRSHVNQGFGIIFFQHILRALGAIYWHLTISFVLNFYLFFLQPYTPFLFPLSSLLISIINFRCIYWIFSLVPSCQPLFILSHTRKRERYNQPSNSE